MRSIVECLATAPGPLISELLRQQERGTGFPTRSARTGKSVPLCLFEPQLYFGGLNRNRGGTRNRGMKRQCHDSLQDCHRPPPKIAVSLTHQLSYVEIRSLCRFGPYAVSIRQVMRLVSQRCCRPTTAVRELAFELLTRFAHMRYSSRVVLRSIRLVCFN